MSRLHCYRVELPTTNSGNRSDRDVLDDAYFDVEGGALYVLSESAERVGLGWRLE